ncbi:hypothetical protein [uncultured Novosphingobium sp.]|uniref:hypothetical protein n=1 Tax=uncultured Novosphingobium sp. TaxID=292277 RepID=UPI00374A5DA7
MPIYWDQFDWPSFATLATGVLAVGAALMVGLKQASIAHNQSVIIARQVAIAEADLRFQLFDRRLACFHALRTFVVRIAFEREIVNEEEFKAHVDVVGEAEFLFSPSLWKDIDALSLLMFDANELNRTSELDDDETESKSLNFGLNQSEIRELAASRIRSLRVAIHKETSPSALLDC